jgi:hypothetical protein
MQHEHEAYLPVVNDGRGRFPETLKVKAPRGAQAAIATAAQLKHNHTLSTCAKRYCAAWRLTA